ncbi:MAG: AraC family transcriptional regulator [Gammaproteobacteria bacterium]|nr:AraC family transcriptional regulator [Gammaproteobacteria bacterium]MBU1832306.1 AraC family transcriptional regulator [Gammaproteobacteria bacterium]
MRSPTISIYFIQACLKNLSHQPDKQLALLAKNHISPMILQSTTARVPAENYANLLRDTMQEMDDELMGYGSLPQKLGCWSTMVELAANSSNLGESLKKLARFYRLVPWGLETKLSTDSNGNAYLSLNRSNNERGDRQFDPYLYESFLFYIHRTANWLIGRQIPLHAVDFCFAETPHRQVYWDMYFCKDIYFQQPLSQLRFSSAMLDLPVAKSAQAVSAFLSHVNQAMITQVYAQKSWHYKVSTRLEAQLSDNPSFSDFAKGFNIHPHTLRSYLRDEGFQYQDIKDRVRRDSAIFYLSSRGKSVEDAAALTGFSEASAFIRAFKKWTGNTPIHYKRKS